MDDKLHQSRERTTSSLGSIPTATATGWSSTNRQTSGSRKACRRINCQPAWRTNNNYLSHRNTYYWSRYAYAAGYPDYTRAKLYHWLHR